MGELGIRRPEFSLTGRSRSVWVRGRVLLECVLKEVVSRLGVVGP